MTTMELNLRKQSLAEIINSMDEEMVAKMEKYARKLAQSKAPAKEPIPYPWAPTEEELCAIVAEAEPYC